jgi:CheY-like chemotaxis protein
MVLNLHSVPEMQLLRNKSTDQKDQKTECQDVLLIDDDEGIRETLKIFLEMEGYSVTAAADGKEGIEALSKIRPCVILLDLMMPVMNGWEFVDALKNTRCADSPVVVVTAYTDRIDTIKHSGIIGKPIDLAVLQRTLQKWC